MVLRSQFRMMKPTFHHHEPEKSEVLAHICQVLGCDLKRAEKAFGSMRNVKSRVLIFDGQSRTWRGCDWVPDDKESAIRELQYQIIKIQAELRYIRRVIGNKTRVTSRKSKLKEEVAYLKCSCQSLGFEQTHESDIYKCKICGKTTTNNNLKIYNLWDTNGNKVINGDGI